jgi:hypothetical protein
MQSRVDLVDRSVVWGLHLFLLGVGVILPRLVFAFVLVGSSSAAVYQQLASAECGGTFSVVPLSVACGAYCFPTSRLLNFFSFDEGYVISGMPWLRRMEEDAVLE